MDRSQGGLGIGLTLVKRLVEIHGGSVEAHSEGQGKGSEFVVRLPLLIEQPKAQTPKATVEQTPTTSHRILIVDDNRDAAASLGVLLRITGNEIQTAYDGLEAVEMAATFRPDVVLLDLGMPCMNGFEVAHRFREDPAMQSAMLVAVTGWGSDDDRRRTLAAGFARHLVKPIDPEELIALLRNHATNPTAA